MSEKKWTLKLKSRGRRGRHHKGKEFPRHATNLAVFMVREDVYYEKSILLVYLIDLLANLLKILR